MNGQNFIFGYCVIAQHPENRAYLVHPPGLGSLMRDREQAEDWLESIRAHEPAASRWTYQLVSVQPTS